MSLHTRFLCILTAIATVATTNGFFFNPFCRPIPPQPSSPTPEIGANIDYIFNTFDIPVPVKIHSTQILETKPAIPVFEPLQNGNNQPPKRPACLLFFTGLYGYMPYDIYSTLLHTIATLNVTVYVPDADYSTEEIRQLAKKLQTDYTEIIPVSHSSGSLKIFDAFADKPEIKKAILLDPVNGNMFSANQHIVAPHMKNILLIHAKKTYEGNLIPFIPPFFRVKEETFVLDKGGRVDIIESAEHGHCDVLNPYYSNIISSKIKLIGASQNRTSIYDYHHWIAQNIQCFITL
jgi:hypothetical protein